MNTRLALLVDSVSRSAPRPPVRPLAERAVMRGAIWPKLGLADLPYGPRPGSPDNIAMLDGIEVFTLEQQRQMMDAYQASSRRYTHTTMGPIIDPGYHGQIPATDLSDWPAYLAAATEWTRRDVQIVHFLRPDGGVQGLDWTPDDLDRVLGPLFRDPSVQDLFQIVCLGWEPGGKYGYDNAWWVEMVQWMAETFPNALRCIHTPPDEDAPVGKGDDGHPNLAAWAWGNVAPYIHCWLVQNAGYTDSGDPVPSPDFLTEFRKQFDVNNPASLVGRFQHGYGGWPTASAWPDRGIVAIPFEYWSYGGYWLNYPSGGAHICSDAAVDVGCPSFMDDGGTH